MPLDGARTRRTTRHRHPRSSTWPSGLCRPAASTAFSYADVAAELGVTKASLHYHFAEQGRAREALIERYSERFARARWSAIDAGAAAMRPPSSRPTPTSTPSVLRERAHVPVRHARRRLPDAAPSRCARRSCASSTTTRPGSPTCSRRARPTARCASPAQPATRRARSSAGSRARCSSRARTAT